MSLLNKNVLWKRITCSTLGCARQLRYFIQIPQPQQWVWSLPAHSEWGECEERVPSVQSGWFPAVAGLLFQRPGCPSGRSQARLSSGQGPFTAAPSYFSQGTLQNHISLLWTSVPPLSLCRCFWKSCGPSGGTELRTHPGTTWLRPPFHLDTACFCII